MKKGDDTRMSKNKLKKKGNKYYAFVWNKYTKKNLVVTDEDENLCLLKKEQLKYDLKTNPSKYSDSEIIGKSKSKLSQTFSEAFDLWLENKNDCIEDTKEDYRSIKKNHLKPISEIKIKDINDDIIQELYTNILQSKPKSTLLRVHSCLRAFIKHLYKKKIIDVNYMDFVTVPKKDKVKHSHCSIDEYKKILDLLKKENTELPYLYMLIILTGCVGLRIGEALGIDINNINIEQGYININQQVNFRKGKGYVILKTLKNSSSERKAPIANLTFVSTELKQYLLKREQYIKKCRKIDPNFAKGTENLLFINEKGNVIPTNTIDRYWREFKNKNGINPKIRIHDLRRFFANLLLKNNIPDKIGSDALGHSNLEMTKYYQDNDISMSCNYISNIKI